jgi:hypothetical protein
MYDLHDLKRLTGLTENQLRDRLGLLTPIMGDDLHRGARGKILVGDRMLAALRRMVELEREGLSPKVAQGEVLKELGGSHPDGDSGAADPWRRWLEEKDARIADLQAQVARLSEESRWLRSQLEAALARIPQLPPADRVRNVSRWQALKYALLGRP